MVQTRKVEKGHSLPLMGLCIQKSHIFADECLLYEWHRNSTLMSHND